MSGDLRAAETPWAAPLRREAARLFAELAVDRARALGPDHPDTLT